MGTFRQNAATVIRLFVGAVILWVATAWRREMGETVRLWKDGKAFRALIGGTVAGPFLGIWFSLVSVQLARLGIASTLMSLPPVILIPVEFAVYGARVSWRGILGMLAALAGVALIFLA